MARFRSNRTGSLIETDAETAARMGTEWEPVDEKSKPARKRTAKHDEK